MKPFGISLALIGAIVVAVAFFLMPSTVSTEEMTSLPYTGAIVGSGHFTETYNMPRAQLRDMVAQLGEVLFLGGCILFVGGVLDERLRSGATVAPAYLGDPEVQGDADSYAAAGLAEAERNKRIVAGAIVAGVVILTIVGVIGASNSNRISGVSSPDAAESSAAQIAAENALNAADEAMNAAMNAADNAARAVR